MMKSGQICNVSLQQRELEMKMRLAKVPIFWEWYSSVAAKKRKLLELYQAYPAHIVCLNFSKHYRRLPIDDRHTILPVRSVSKSWVCHKHRKQKNGIMFDLNGELILLSDNVSRSIFRCARKLLLEVLYTKLQSNLTPMHRIAVQSFGVCLQGKTWTCHEIVVWYSSDISREKDISRAMRGDTF